MATLLLVALLLQLQASVQAFTWRSSLVGARLDPFSDYCSEDSSSTYSSCATRCQSLGRSCLSFHYSDDVGCYTCATRFGFNDTSLKVNNDYTYYEKPVDVVDNLGDLLYQSQSNNGGVNSFLSRFRQGIVGYVTDSEMVTISGMDSAEECAKYCTRRRGVMDDVVGTRCHSFNYHSSTSVCELMTNYLDPDNGYDINLALSAWTYYERLTGDGCWVTMDGCRLNEDTYALNFEAPNVEWEYQCMEMNQYYHEYVCDGYSSVPIVTYWGGDDHGVYGSWYSWDLTTGCVIDLGGECNPTGVAESRFGGKFRDSYGEDAFAAWYSAERCFARAQTWYDYCNIGAVNDSRQVNVSFPDTGEYYIVPLNECECETEYGTKLDIATQRYFCTRANPDSVCFRSRSDANTDLYSYADILCDDVTCPEFATNWTVESTLCYALELQCDNGYLDGYNYELLCSDALVTDVLGITNCGAFTESDCINAAETIHSKCDNDFSSSSDQITTLYQPTGLLSVYPNFDDPFETTLMNGLIVDASYAPTSVGNIRLVDVSQGRFMIFTSENGGTVRQIDVWYKNDYSASITLALYRGEGTTTSTFVCSSTDTYGPTSTNGSFIHFPMFATIEADTVYTWQMASGEGSVSGVSTIGSIGWVDGNPYSSGRGDLTWDYPFVVWVEGSSDEDAAMQTLYTVSGPGRPWFEVWFWLLIAAWILFAVFLCLIHWKRKMDEKREKEDERQLQSDIRESAKRAMEEDERQKREKFGADYDAVDDDDEFTAEEKRDDLIGGATQTDTTPGGKV